MTDAQGRVDDGGGGKAAQPSGPKGDDPSTAGPGETRLHSTTPENLEGRLNPSAPGNTGTTPGSDGVAERD